MEEIQRRWIGKLEAEIARELGQPVSVSAGGELPGEDEAFLETLEVPGARLVVAVDGSDLAKLLVEARVLEAGQSDAEMSKELWSGILGTVSARLGGKLARTGERKITGEPCSLRLGQAAMRMVVEVEAREARPVGEPHSGRAREGNFDLLLEVELDASVRFGAREMELGELLELGPGDVVELDRHVADPVDLIVGDKIVARGEVVLVNGNFGLRITELAEPMRRLESIRCLS